MRFLFIASGSKGNATLIESDSTLIQIDMGITLRRLTEALSMWSKDVSDIKAVFVTHGHSDHVSGLKLLKNKCQIYAPIGVAEKYTTHQFQPYDCIEIGDLKVTSFPVSHDDKNPVNYLISDNREKLGFVTDTGYLTEENLSFLKDCDYYVLEANHDLSMLHLSSRPKILQDRISGDHGHLCNDQSSLYACKLINKKTKAIYLAHLSQECNKPELAISTYKRYLIRLGIDPNIVPLIPLKQNEPVIGGDL